VVLPCDSERDVGETVDEIAERLDFGIGHPAVVAQNLAASSYGQHSTRGLVSQQSLKRLRRSSLRFTVTVGPRVAAPVRCQQL